MKKIVEYICLSVIAVCLSFLLICGVRVFVCDRFVIKGDSMSPTFESGEAVWVNKLLMGARIYTDYDFDSPELKAFRIPGFRKPRVNDVVIFNYPHGRERYKIEFRINFVYAKRVLGCPGDRIWISDGYCHNDGHNAPFGVPHMQTLLSETPDTLLGYNPNAFPLTEEVGWTVYDMGPLLVPAKGIAVEMDRLNYLLYRHVIEYETGLMPVWTDEGCTLQGTPVDAYTFEEDYYYLIGDNVLNSKDSRYFGFVPEIFLTGIVVR